MLFCKIPNIMQLQNILFYSAILPNIMLFWCRIFVFCLTWKILFRSNPSLLTLLAISTRPAPHALHFLTDVTPKYELWAPNPYYTNYIRHDGAHNKELFKTNLGMSLDFLKVTCLVPDLQFCPSSPVLYFPLSSPVLPFPSGLSCPPPRLGGPSLPPLRIRVQGGPKETTLYVL